MFKEFWERFKNLKNWQQGLFLLFVLAIVGIELVHLGVFKLPSAKAYDCSNVKSYQILEIKVSDKFDPNKIDAYLCDHLKFIAVDDAGHWPAVGPHPTHTSYPGLDAKRPLRAGESFEFVLNRAGYYTFHDHLHEQVTGTLNVHNTPRQGNPPVRPSSAKDQKVVYLTFDADMTLGMKSRAEQQGLVWYDPKLTDYLQQNHIPATIFVTGLFGQMYPELVSSLSHNMNIEIGNHTYDHEAFESSCYGLPMVFNFDAKKQEISQAQEILKNLIGYEPKYFRYPGLCHSASDDQIVKSFGLMLTSSDLVSGDAFSHNPDGIVSHVMSNIKSGSVIVMHLGGPNAPATYDAVRKLVPEIEKAGYTLATLSPRSELAQAN